MVRLSDNVLIIIAGIFLFLALGNLFYNLENSDTDFITGFAGSDTGEASVEIVGAISINFSVNSTDFGSGAVNTSAPNPGYALLFTNGTVTYGNWSSNTQFLVLENVGNLNVSFDLNATNGADGFIGGSGPLYQVKISNNESNSCNGTSNFTDYHDINVSAQLGCSLFQFHDTKDELNLDIKLKIPSSATPGTKSSTIIATAIAVEFLFLI